MLPALPVHDLRTTSGLGEAGVYVAFTDTDFLVCLLECNGVFGYGCTEHTLCGAMCRRGLAHYVFDQCISCALMLLVPCKNSYAHSPVECGKYVARCERGCLGACPPETSLCQVHRTMVVVALCIFPV